MAESKSLRKSATAKRGHGPVHSIAAAGFKARCLELMDRVRETGVEYVITKHGKPVAKLVPYTDRQQKPLFGSMKGSLLKYERPLDPPDDEWNVNRD
jgi:prevent-host-death family protein